MLEFSAPATTAAASAANLESSALRHLAARARLGTAGLAARRRERGAVLYLVTGMETCAICTPAHSTRATARRGEWSNTQLLKQTSNDVLLRRTTSHVCHEVGHSLDLAYCRQSSRELWSMLASARCTYRPLAALSGARHSTFAGRLLAPSPRRTMSIFKGKVRFWVCWCCVVPCALRCAVEK